MKRSTLRHRRVSYLLPARTRALAAMALLATGLWPRTGQGAGADAVMSPSAATPTATRGEPSIDQQLSEIGRQGAHLADDEHRAAVERATPLRDEVLIIGSSSVRGMLGRVFVKRLGELGFSARRIGQSASGLSRLDYHDWIGAVDDLPITSRTLAVIVYVGINDPQGIWLRPDERETPRRKWTRWQEAAWSDIYRSRVVELINTLCVRGVPDVIFLTPADVRWHSLQERLVRIRRLQIEGARESACGHAFSASGDSLYLFEPDEQTQPRRLHDGYHMTTYGAQLVFNRIRPRLLRLLRRRQGATGSALD